MAVSGTTKALKDIMRIDAGINGDAQYIEQITWMLFLKAFDYKEQEWELTEDDYYPIVPTEYRWSTWAADAEGITGDALLSHIDTMFSALRDLDISDDPKHRKWLIRSIMEGVNNFMKSGTLLRQVINKINADIDFDAMPSGHLFNGLYETMLKDLQSAGKSGEFYTPRPVTRFIVEQVNPKLGETVLDPACGTGGFLTSVIDRFTVNTTEEYKTLQRTIKGIEKKPFPYLLCVTNLIAHGIDVPDIRHENTLRKSTGEYTAKDKVEVIVTNPPFGGAEEKAISQSVPAELRNSETADLFLVHMMALLKDGGRCGLVLPDGFLFGTGVKAAIKKKLLEECNLHTIVRLPKDVFAPYTNINTNLLFFTKGTPTKGVWYYRLEMPNGYKHFSKTRPMMDEHFQPVRDWWKNKVESDVSQFVPAEDIAAADYNLDFCGFPHDTEEILPPDQFIPQYLNEKAVLSARIEEILGRISAAVTQEDVL
ncbi:MULTISPECIES: type I restriction-modification system subunit M [Eubacteriales]|uniref:site-specific DNA-methyltransferase (adenine-specific) n=1 Tax=Intestinimonas butyriciproducens TaxID=1297617 RepID=A0A2U1BIT7_9FIRM|nr:MULTISPECIES: class I SAM-dependent DNA methyltransferase [Eubacteriales]MCR1906860.1 type I restriction-modification system subunit M [Intestinimonas butyriciproducens]OUO69406.1 SAM-dependent methyltransferase [Anaerotruncus colihominis]PVY48578.1 type I restriction enzyme M protein [Intestinimonas butyriciproducens]QBB65049.1 Type I restriction-modification system, DNA-methyltransferase subunit M [Intestinimonas butyriciproducens]